MALTDSEKEYIEEKLGREPNELEDGMLDVMFSEHCSYKTSRPLLAYFPNEGENVIIGPGDDAAIVSVTDDVAVALALESHNHPSAIEPYSGAGTGVGGIVRDIISMGASPVGVLDSLRFGKLEDERSRFLFENAVKGASDYANTIKVPIVDGEVEFDSSYTTNPLVNVVALGLVNKKDIIRGIAPNVGDIFLLIGGGTGRDGIHGVTFASEELTEDSTGDDSSVAVGDPEMKYKIINSLLEIYEKFDVSGVKDLGGGGLTCCISEMADGGGNGAEVNIEAIYTKEDNMNPYEKMLSESQERMVLAISPDDLDAIVKICDEHDVPSAVLGKVITGNKFIVKEKNEIIANLPTNLLADPPSITRPTKAPETSEDSPVYKHSNFKESLLKILSSASVCDKTWINEQADHSVQGNIIVPPGDDAAVLNIDDEKALICSVISKTSHTKLSPYNGGAGSLAEATAKVVAMGGRPYAVADNLNFGNPEIPENLWELEQAIKGIADLANTLKTPVVGGNVSLYNETDGVKINPTPVLSVVGVGDTTNIKTIPFKNEGDKIILVGKTYFDLDGSEYSRTIHELIQGTSPAVNNSEILENSEAVLSVVSNEDVTAIHSVGSGGIAVALSKMSANSDLGAKIDIEAIDKEISSEGEDLLFDTLFSESYGRYLLTVKERAVDEVMDSLANVSAKVIGEVKGDKLILGSTEIAVSEIKENYLKQFEKYLEI